jgi:phosphoribosylformylglycinamidine synthase
MKIGIIRYPGSNCDLDTLNYFENSFFIWHKETELPEMDLLVIPGGFAFGDRDYVYATGKYTISPGTMAVRSPVTKLIYEAVEKKIPILGICNGFQILTKLLLLPGELRKNSNNKFTSKKVQLEILCNNNEHNKTETELYIANSYGNYQCYQSEYNDMAALNQIFLRYVDFNNGSVGDIAGICNFNRTIFGMMPHPERNNQCFKNILHDIIFNSDNNKIYNQIPQKISNPINEDDIVYNIDNDLIANTVYSTMKNPREMLKEKINNLFNSEHISYKSTRKYLKKLYTDGDHVIQGPGENAGIVDIGGGYCIAMRIESHNHPTFIDPYEGAATGVGGILRDIFTMGARPIAILDFLRFGTDDNSDRLLSEAIRGIADYGNCVGVANVGGDLYRDPTYNKNPLVNVGCLGLIKKDNIIYGNALTEHSLLIYIGGKTGNEGIDGAAMASQSFENDNIDDLKDNVQKSDAFLERLLLEACCEIADKGLAEGMQDMGACGLLCASVEVLIRGRAKTGENIGCTIDLDKVPTKHAMEPYNILVSESQERMLIISTEKNKESIQEILNKWDLEYAVIGRVDYNGVYTVYHNVLNIYAQGMTAFTNIEEDWSIDKPAINNMNSALKKEKVKNKALWEEYDTTIGNRTLKGPLDPGSYSILNIPENGTKLVLTWGEEFMEAYQKMEELGAKALCLVNCLNYGHPKDIMWDFKETIDELSNLCEKYKVPVVGGNVSLYNTTNDVSIRGTPILLMLGIIS